MNESMDDILKYVEKLTSYVQGEVKVGDYESLSILGSKEQQHLSEISQDISQLFLNQSDEIGSTISLLLDKLTSIRLPQSREKRCFFVKKKKQSPESVILGQYTDANRYIEKLTCELELEKVQLLKEEHLLTRLESQLKDCEQDLLMCEKKGTHILKTKSALDDDVWWERLEQRLNDISVSKIVTKQSLLQIQLLSKNNTAIINKIESLLENVVPIWKKQIEIFVSVMKKTDDAQICQLMEEEMMLLSKFEIADGTIRKELESVSL